MANDQSHTKHIRRLSQCDSSLSRISQYQKDATYMIPDLDQLGVGRQGGCRLGRLTGTWRRGL